MASGRADCGLGIAAAAQALDLEFIPLFQERYDLGHSRSSLRKVTCLRLFSDFWLIAVFERLYLNCQDMTCPSWVQSFWRTR